MNRPRPRRVVLSAATALALVHHATSPLPALVVPADPGASQRVRSVPVEATVTSVPPEITLHFLDADDDRPYRVRRRDAGDVAWSADLAVLAAGTPSWTDDTVEVSRHVEYQVLKELDGGGTAFGYVSAGIDVDRTGDRGAVLVVVDPTLRDPLASEIDRYLEDLAGDGWRPLEMAGTRGVGWDDPAGAAGLRSAIAALWTSLPELDRPNHLVLLGHLPVARSGLDGTPPDGHDENRGAIATDAFYADVDGLWTDAGTAPEGVRESHENAPGDGRYDPDFLPSPLEMAFGRIDFADIFSPIGETEVDLMRRYLDRNHAYRHRDVGFELEGRGVFLDGFGESVEMGWRTFPGIFGADGTEFAEFADVDAAGGPVAWASTFGPWDLFAQNQRVPDLSAHETLGTNALLWSSDQSYFGLWAEPFSILRELLSTPGINLAWVWEVSPSYVFTDLGMGATIGDAVRRTAEHSLANNLFERPEQAYDEDAVWNRQFITLLGDPTVRLFAVEPPSEVSATHTGGGVRLDWAPLGDPADVGVLVARGPSAAGPFMRRTAEPVTGTTWTDPEPDAAAPVYRVRTVRRITTGGGTFLGTSQGVAVSAAGLFADGFESGDTSAWGPAARRPGSPIPTR